MTAGKSGSSVGSNAADSSQKKVNAAGKGFGKPFKKADPRINKLGRPKVYEEARKAAIEMMHEKVVVNDPNRPGEKLALSRFEILYLDWLTSRNFQKQQGAFQVAFGKGNDNIQMNIDLSTLTNAQLERLSKGEDIFSVLTNPNK